MASTGTRIRQHTNKLVFSRRSQIAYGVSPVTVDATAFDMLMYANSPVYARRGPDRRARTGVAGVEFPHRTDDYKVNSGFNVDMPIGINSAAWIIPFAYGSVANAGPLGSTYYTNTCKLLTTNALPVTGVILEGSSTAGSDGSDVLYYDMACNGFSITGSGGADGVINISSDWMGSGRMTEDVSNLTATVVKDGLCRMGNLSFTLGTNGAEASITPQVADFTYSYANNMIDNYFPGGDKYATNSLVGNERTHSLEFTIYQDGTDNYLDWFTPELGTLLAATIRFTQDDDSDAYIELDVPQLYITGLEQTTVNDHNAYRVTTQIVFDPDGAGYSSGNNSGVVVTISKPDTAFSPLPLAAFAD